MEDSNKIDRLFNERLSEGESLPPADTWGAIRGKMTQKEVKQKRIFPIPFLWLSAAFVSGLLIGGLGLYTYQLKNENNELKKLLAQGHQNNINEKYLNNINKIEPIVNKNQTSLSEVNSLEKNKEIFQKHDIQNDLSFRDKEIDNNLAISDSKGIANPTIFNERKIIYKNRFKEKQMESVSLESNQISINSYISEATQIVQNSVNENVINQSTKVDQSIIADSLKKDSIKTASKSEIEKLEVSIKKKTPKIFGLPIAVGFYLSPEMASRSVNFSMNSSDDVKRYKQNDKNIFGFGAGLNLELELPRNYFFRTGISYWNVGERNTSEYRVAKSDTTYSPNSVYVRTTNISTGNGTSTTIVAFDSSKAITSSPNNLTGQKISLAPSREIRESFNHFTSSIQNNYHYIGIPVVIGLRLGQSRFRAGMYSGLIANVLVSSNKAVYSVYYDPRSDEKYVQSSRQLSRFSMVYWGGVDFDYQLTANWSVTLSPNIKYSMTSLYQNEPEVRQLPYSFGVLFGCKYSFGK